MARDCAFPVLRDIFIRHSAVLSLTAVLLRKVASNVASNDNRHFRNKHPLGSLSFWEGGGGSILSEVYAKFIVGKLFLNLTQHFSIYLQFHMRN